MTEQIKDNPDLSLPFKGTGGIPYLLHLADNALILAQRNSEWCGHGPVLEQDIAITNISLDLLGQARNFYQHAANLYNETSDAEKQFLEHLMPEQWKTYKRQLQEDDLAFLREEHQYLNLLICELPRGDWAHTIMRQFFFSSYQVYLYRALQTNDDAQLEAIAAKGLKEGSYHLRWSSEWVIRLGDGTEESSSRINKALEELWPFTTEMFMPASYESVDVLLLKNSWINKINAILTEATVKLPVIDGGGKFFKGGKAGIHTEHLKGLLSEMQYLQRTYPNATW